MPQARGPRRNAWSAFAVCARGSRSRGEGDGVVVGVEDLDLGWQTVEETVLCAEVVS